ncbi:MAG: AmmeMemoRadiSam system protein A [Burkholderiales bacterium]|nr:AmmeMemoRadiSam system protein A [Burkholderiales bacterium]
MAMLPPDAGAVLLPIARAAIATALGRATTAETTPTWLREPGACFVTLTQRGQLRGCIGSLLAHRSLLADVQANSVAAATRDPRFVPLPRTELDGTDIEVSVLSTPQPMDFSDEADALAQLRPGVDGVVFHCGHQHSTFLPQVWEQLPDRVQFMAQLKRKAGLDAHFWSDDVRLERYTVQQWAESPSHQG